MVLQWLVLVCTGADGLEKHCCLCISALCWVEEGLNGLAACVLSFCDTFCPVLR